MLADVENILTFKMRGNRVLVKPSEKDIPKTQGGILLTDKTADSMLASGSVISAGPQVPDLKAGDIVYFYKGNSEGLVRQGDDIFPWFADYNIVAILDTPPLQVDPSGEITTG